MIDPPLDGRPILFGEILYDCFPDGAEVLGGAPFNVAWHLTGFGLDPLLLCRVGDDDRGRQVLAAMAAWGMDTRGVQIDPDRPTGTVEVTLEDGQPSFEIKSGCAPEAAALKSAQTALDAVSASCLYHGTVIRRGDVSRATLEHLRRTLQRPVFVDLNLRPPWDASDIADSLAHAQVLKLNDAELAEVAGQPGRTDPDAVAHAAESLMRQHALDQLIITEGARGARLFRPDAPPVHARPVPVDTLADTVGAGDALSSVLLLGLHRGWDPPDTLTRGVAFASAICGIQGATSRDRSLYQAVLTP